MTEQITITQSSGLGGVSGEVYVAEEATEGTQELVEVSIKETWTKPYLTAEDDPVLAKLWDNDDDAIFDKM